MAWRDCKIDRLLAVKKTGGWQHLYPGGPSFAATFLATGGSPLSCPSTYHSPPAIHSFFMENRAQERVKKYKFANLAESALKNFSFRGHTNDVCNARILFGSLRKSATSIFSHVPIPDFPDFRKPRSLSHPPRIIDSNRSVGARKVNSSLFSSPFLTQNRALHSETRIDGFGFQGQDAEDAFVDASEGFIADETFEGFDAQGEFAQS